MTTPSKAAARAAAEALLPKLRKTYGQPTVPPCPVCGEPRTGICQVGGGTITYCCSSDDAEPRGKGERFKECMDHFSRSRKEMAFTEDSDVLQLCDAFEELAIIDREFASEEAVEIIDGLTCGSPYRERQDGDDCDFCGFYSGNAAKKLDDGIPEAELHKPNCQWLKARAFLAASGKQNANMEAPNA